MMKIFKYAALVDGVPAKVLMDAEIVQRAHPELNVPVQSLTDAQLLELGACRVVVPPFPIDGYNYVSGDHVQQDGVWTATWVQQPTPNRDDIMYRRAHDVRKNRNTALTECDWTQMADAPLPAEKRAEWGTYRQALRDLTAQPTFPWQVEWPIKPA